MAVLCSVTIPFYSMLKHFSYILLQILFMCTVLIGETHAQVINDLQAQLKAAKAETKAITKQKDSLKYCLREAKYYTNDKQAYNFDKARSFLKMAFANPLGKDNAEVWLQAGHTEYKCFQAERNKPASNKKIDEKVIYNSTAAGFEYYLKAYEMLKPIEQHVSSKQMLQIRTNAYELFRATQGFRATAGYYYNKKDYEQAHKFFRMGLEALDSPLLNDFARYNGAMALDFDRFKNDSVRTRLMYSCAVTAVKMGNHLLAIRELERVKRCNIETNLVYQQLCLEYEAMDNMEGFERTLRDGMELMPDSIWYPQNLLNLYLSQHAIEKALPIADRVIALAPEKASNYELKGRLLEEISSANLAELAYLEALKHDPMLLLSNVNLGRIYFNRAVMQEDAYIESRKFDDIYTEVVPMYEKALPYYYRAYELDSNREEESIATAIRTILYKRFQNPKCKDAKKLIRKYNEVSQAYGMQTL